MIKNKSLDIKNIGIFIYPGVEELDFVGPWEIFTMWREYANGPDNIMTVGHNTEPFSCAKGLKVVPDVSIFDCPALDILVIPGGYAAFNEMQNEQTILFVKKQSVKAIYTLSICSGVFILAEAGVLKNKKATTHWKALDLLRKNPDITVIEERYVQDGHVWTSAGVSAGTDMVLAFVADVAGEAAAANVQLNAEYYPEDKQYKADDLKPNIPKYVKRGANITGGKNNAVK